MINFDNIVDGIFVGSCPVSNIDVLRLKQAGMSAILNLQTDRDFKVYGINWQHLEQQYLDHGIASYRYQIIDFNDDDLTELLPGAVDMLARMLETHPRVYVHCTAGKQRSPSTVIGYLAWYKKYGIERAIDFVMSTRNCAPPLEVLRKVDEFRAASALP